MIRCIAVSQFMNPSGPVSVCQQCNSSEFELDLKNECVCKEGFIAEITAPQSLDALWL